MHKEYKKLRSSSLKRLHQIIAMHMNNSPYALSISGQIYAIFAEHFTTEALMPTQEQSCLLQIVSLWCSEKTYIPLIIEHNSILHSVSYMLSHAENSMTLLQIVSNLLNLAKMSPELLVLIQSNSLKLISDVNLMFEKTKYK